MTIPEQLASQPTRKLIRLYVMATAALLFVACSPMNLPQRSNVNAGRATPIFSAQAAVKNENVSKRPPDGSPFPGLVQERVPEFWPNPKLAKPKWPTAHPDARPDVGMDRIKYWEKLCRLEAGEFIYRKADKVEGVYLIRPVFVQDPGFGDWVTQRLLRSRYLIEDPYTANVGMLLIYSIWPLTSGYYPFVEMPAIDFNRDFSQARVLYSVGKPIPEPFVTQKETYRDVMIREGGKGSYYRYIKDPTPRYDEEWFRFMKEKRELSRPRHERRVSTIQSRYGVYWRGISRPQDREMGIEGGEVMVIDLATNEIMAVHRGFVLANEARDKSSINWLSAAFCPEDPARIGPDNFIRRVLKSADKNGWLPEQEIQ